MTKVAVEIPASRAGMIAKFFQEEGLEVSWRGPLEKSSGGPELVQLVHIVYFLKENAATGVVGGASYALVQAAVRKIRERFPSIKVEIEEDGADEDEDI